MKVEMNPKEGRARIVKESRVCRGFKQMYAMPSKCDPAAKSAPREQVNTTSFRGLSGRSGNELHPSL